MEDIKGIVFNIQKFSVNDGPGIRTVVFLKGCPLHCAWCANPESQLARPQVLVDHKKCQQCLHCTEVCKNGAVSFKDGKIVIDHIQCKACETCVSECPGRALKMEDRAMSVEEVMQVVRQDLPFYEESNGGMTISGGELFMQKDFAIALAKKAKKEQIHTACETTAYCSDEAFEEILPYLDYIFIDCKHYDEAKHIQATGVSNVSVLKHIGQAVKSGKEVLVRIPVIPGVNDALTDAHGFADVFQTIGVKKVQLLPFHQFGENKYDMLHKEYAFHDVAAYHKEDLQTYCDIFLKNGIHAFF